MPNRDVAALVDENVGENLDRLMTLDFRGDGISRVLAAAARRHVGAPLALAAARRLREGLARGGTALFLTGFVVPPWGVGETDGLIGTIVLARALERAFGASIVVVSEAAILPPLGAGFREAGLLVYDSLESVPGAHSVCLLPFPKDGDADFATYLARATAPAVCVAVERAGRNAIGEYHYALGRNVSDWIAPVDLLYEAVAARGVLTVAYGDFGNELGMGAVASTVAAETPAGSDCGCPCHGGIACPIPADVTVACSVSDWGAYATSAALAYLQRDESLFVSPRDYEDILRATVRAGSVDGTSQYAVPAIDGVGLETNSALVALMHAACAYPAAGERFRPVREFRARRLADESR